MFGALSQRYDGSYEPPVVVRYGFEETNVVVKHFEI